MSWDFGKVRTRLTQLLWTTRIFDCALSRGTLLIVQRDPVECLELSLTQLQYHPELMVVTIARPMRDFGKDIDRLCRVVVSCLQRKACGRTLFL